MLLKRKLLTRKRKTQRKRRMLQRQQKRKSIERKEQSTETERDGKRKSRETERLQTDGGLGLVQHPGPGLGFGGQVQGLEAGPEGSPGQGALLGDLDPQAWIVWH